MLKKEVKIGSVYAVKVSGVLAPVKIIGTSTYGGWDGENVRTKRNVRIRTAAKLRYELQKDGNKWRPVAIPSMAVAENPGHYDQRWDVGAVVKLVHDIDGIPKGTKGTVDSFQVGNPPLYAIKFPDRKTMLGVKYDEIEQVTCPGHTADTDCEIDSNDPCDACNEAEDEAQQVRDARRK